MLGKYQEIAFTKWFLTNSIKGTQIIRAKGKGIPDYCIALPFTTAKNEGIFVEVKYRSNGKATPSFKLLSTQQRLFFYNFNTRSFLAYRTNTIKWKLYYYNIRKKRLVVAEVFDAYK